MLLDAAGALRPGLRTAAAYIDNASPSVRTELERLAVDGVSDVVVLPLLLTAASHSKTDVAASVQVGRRAHPAMRLRYGRPLGPHPTIIEVLAARLVEAGAADDDPVVLAAGGSVDPDANAQVAATARLLWEGRSWPSVDVAFASTTRPTVLEVLERLRALGHRRAAVARYFVGPGHLPSVVERQAHAVDGLDVVLSGPLGATPQLAALVLSRYDEAITGDIRMNCDVCLYRVQLPGHEDAVGAAQFPHEHPDDPPS